MAEGITLKSFPFDSMEVLNAESGKMEDDRLYEAEIFRKYFAKFLSNGVYFGEYKGYKENSMKVTADGGLNIKIAMGAGIIEGADFENEENKIITLERPVAGNRIDRIIIKLDKSLAERNTYLIVKQGNGSTPAILQRDSNIYEICIAEVTVKSSTNIVQNDIIDKRTNKELCGIVNSLISVDGEELYQRFQNYIDSVSINLVRKDENSIINGNVTLNDLNAISIVATNIKDLNNNTLSENSYTTVEKNKLKGIELQANKTIINSTLTSTSTTEALSADMGKKLNEEKQKNILCGSTTPSQALGIENDIYMQVVN